MGLVQGLKRLNQVVKDVRAFGPGVLVLLRPGVRKGGPISLALNIGNITLRPQETDLRAFRQVFMRGEYDLDRLPGASPIRVRYDAIVASGKLPVIIDAGANVGAATLWFKKLFPKAAIVAVEPDPDNAALLRRNVAALPDVEIKEAAIGSEPGFVSLDGDLGAWGVQTTRSDKGCPIVTMNECFASVADGEPLFAKIDIEGFEEDLFTKNLEWVDKVQAILLEPHDWMLPGKKSSRPFQKVMGARDFDLMICGENLVYVR